MKAADLHPGMHILWRVPGQAPVSGFVRAETGAVLRVDCSDRSVILGSAESLEAQGLLKHAEPIPGPTLYDEVIVDSPHDDGTIATGAISALPIEGRPTFRLALDIGEDGELWDLPASHWGTRIRPKEPPR